MKWLLSFFTRSTAKDIDAALRRRKQLRLSGQVQVSPHIRAMPSARAGRATPRAAARLGHTATIAIAGERG